MSIQAPLSSTDAIAALGAMDDGPESEEENESGEGVETSDADDDTEIEAEADATTAEADDDQGESEGTSAEVDEVDKDEPELPAIDPPQFLDATKREAFKALPRAAQEMILEHDRSLVADYTRKTQEAAAKRKTLDTRLEKIAEVMTEREQSLKDWDEVDWVDLAGKVSAEEYNRYQAQMLKERREYTELRNAKAGEEAENLREHNETELRALAEIAPELADPKEGSKRRGEVIAYLHKEVGMELDDLRFITAKQLALAADGRRWREHQASLKAQKALPPKLKPKPDAKSAGKIVKPAARQAPLSKQGEAVKTFKKAPSMANAMAALNALDD